MPRCRTCGARLRYAVGQTALACTQCGTRQELAPWGWTRTAGLEELPLAPLLAGAAAELETLPARLIDCTACGAETTFPPEMKADECPFCASPLVAPPHEGRQLRPQGVIPFAVTEAEAQARLVAWLDNLPYAPPGLNRYAARRRRLQGVYLPFFTFDALSQSMRLRRPAEASQEVFHDDTLVPASAGVPGSFVDGQRTWDLSALQPWRPELVTGFRAESYSLPLSEGWL